ncbi:MAG: hypothetical protein ACT4QA_08830 [Panacagrimonas sp.]
MQLKPHLEDRGHHLAVPLGTKSGRDRVEPIDTAGKREILDRAKTCCSSASSSTSDPGKKLHQWKNHDHHVARSCGLTR